MKIFNINRGSTVPYLEMEPIVDGRNDFGKLYIAIQSATVTFSMTNVDTGVKKIANAPAYVVPFNDGGCEDRFKIQYPDELLKNAMGVVFSGLNLMETLRPTGTMISQLEYWWYQYAKSLS